MPLYTLEEMIQGVRENILTFSTDLQFRDGHSTDPRNSEDPLASISITRMLNEACDFIASMTGYTGDTTNIAITSGVREYALSSTIGTIVSIYAGHRLLQTTIGILNERHYNWRGSSDIDMRFWYIVGARSIGFHGKPSYNGTADIIHIAPPNVLSALSDTPTRLPSIYGSLPVLVASRNCALADAESEVAAKRAVALTDRVNEGLEELKRYIGILTDTSFVEAVDGPKK